MILLINAIIQFIELLKWNLFSYAEYNEYSNKKCPKFKVGGYIRISKYKNIFAKVYAPNWSEEVLVVVKLKIQFLGLNKKIQSLEWWRNHWKFSWKRIAKNYSKRI